MFFLERVKGLDEMKDRYSFKVTLLGNGGVGKTSLINRYMTNSFQEHYKATMGVQHHKKVIELDEYEIVLNVWDVSGQGKFATFRHLYYSGTDFYIAVLDLKNPKTVEAIPLWIEDVKKLALERMQFSRPFGIMANKRDLFNGYEKNDDLKKYVNSLQVGCMTLLNKYKNELAFFYETSARNGHNVELLFEYIGNYLLQESLRYKEEVSFLKFLEIPYQYNVLGVTI